MAMSVMVIIMVMLLEALVVMVMMPFIKDHSRRITMQAKQWQYHWQSSREQHIWDAAKQRMPRHHHHHR